MTPVAPAPVLQLSSEANAIVAAINGALAPRLDGIQGQMEMLAGQVTQLGDCTVGSTGTTSRPKDE